MIPTLALILLCADPSASRFGDGGFRDPQGDTFATLAKQAVSAKRHGYSVTGISDYRATFASRIFGAYMRYTSPPANPFYQTCGMSRVYDQMRDWDQRRQLTPRQPDELTPDEVVQFKKACWVMLRSDEIWPRNLALRHITLLANRDDVKPLLAMLKKPGGPRDLICITLGRIGDEAALPALEKELGGVNDEQARAAIENIRRLAEH